jgi:hypothetical protein
MADSDPTLSGPRLTGSGPPGVALEALLASRRARSFRSAARSREIDRTATHDRRSGVRELA